MSANTTISVADLDFDNIVTSIKQYVAAETTFEDYNFEGSTISMLIKILAYNTYQNNFYTNMLGNEMFLDSAQLRSSIVSRAKEMGYVPSSTRSASTVLNVTVTGEVADSVTRARGTAFTATGSEGETLNFVTQDAVTFYKARAYTSNVTVYEGYDVRESFTVPSLYKLSNAGIDTASLVVDVRAAVGSSSVERYLVASDINTSRSTSAVYWLQEVENQQYQLTFADGVLGKAIAAPQIVEAVYRVSSGPAANDISAGFTAADATLTVNSVAAATTGGALPETDSSVRFTAAKNYQTQNRAVLANDYEQILLREHGQIIQTLRIYGGEEMEPPIYGKVFASIQPSGSATVLTSTQKSEIKATMAKYSVVALDLEFVDPSYIYIQPTVAVHYDSAQTSLTGAQIASAVADRIAVYETDNLGKFTNSRFRYSEFLAALDNVDSSIQYNITTTTLQKRFAPVLSSTTTYTAYFSHALLNVHGQSSLSSSTFTHGGYANSYLDDDSAGNVRIYYLDSANAKVYTSLLAGTISYTTGTVTLTAFGPTAIAASSDMIDITVIPDGYDMEVDKYLLLLFSDVSVTAVDTQQQATDIVATVSTTGSVTQANEISLGVVI